VITYGRASNADVRTSGDIVERGQSLAFTARERPAPACP
jgi:hypothetical protein